MTHLNGIEYVDIFQISLPLITQDAVIELLLQRLRKHLATGVCFADLSTMNMAFSQPRFRYLIQEKMLILNDGTGLAWAAKHRGHPFPSNLNGTDLCPKLLSLAPYGTTVYILGGRPFISKRAREALASEFPAILFVGDHHGYLNEISEKEVIAELHRLKPRIVLVCMGNPLQVEFICRHLDDPELGGTLWLALGGFIDYYGGSLVRAPRFLRGLHLEWLSIVYQQPYKWKRYFFGAPLFFFRYLWAQWRHKHTRQKDEISS